MTRPTLEMLAQRLLTAQADLPVGSIVRHYKNGDLYIVTDHSIREFNGQPWITFQSGPSSSAGRCRKWWSLLITKDR